MIKKVAIKKEEAQSRQRQCFLPDTQAGPDSPCQPYMLMIRLFSVLCKLKDIKRSDREWYEDTAGMPLPHRHHALSARQRDTCACSATINGIWWNGTDMPRRPIPSLYPGISAISVGIHMPSCPPVSFHTGRIPSGFFLPSCALTIPVPVRWNRYAAVMASLFPCSTALYSCLGSRRRYGWVCWRMQLSAA